MKERMRDVFAEAVQDVVEMAQLEKSKGGRMPNRITGTLINSLASGLNGTFANTGEDSYIVTLAGLKLGDVARFAWTAPYARRLELGFTGTDSLGRNYAHPGNHFVGAAAAQFPQRVAYWSAKVKT
ncbi:hypothetical protein JZX87_10055 [Agrobacterium sp. Ap1]|uniref:hypothetical protein n=1 Tax=Agrobacterium sp. Ap1 TaxID=2815337 RepID=UPI001A8E87D5|nr:hypothetical protein [Agrobacterium sp. Ap1]MBO0141505.1 hypothetical protein [Agrobacterium sp. Ap1]